MSENLKNMLSDIVSRTGRTDLLDTGRIYAKREKELFALIDEKSGAERAEEALKEDEHKLEEEFRPKLKVWMKQLEVIDYRGRAELAAEEMQELEEEEKEKLGQITRVTLLSPEDEKALKKLMKSTHKGYIESIRMILNELDKPLKKYRRAKAVAFLIPKFIYLLFTLIILTIGASMVGDRIQERILKLGFAVAIWAGQEFFVAPLYGKWLSKYRRERLKRFARQLAYIKVWVLFVGADVEHQLKKELKQKTDENQDVSE